MYLGRRCDLQSRVTHTALGAVRSVDEAFLSNVQSGATASANAMKRAGLPVGRPARCNDRVACAQAARRRCNTSTISAISPGAAGSIVKPTLTSIGLDDCDTQERSITAVNEDVSKWGDGFTADVMSTSAWNLSVLSTAQRCTAVPLGSVVVACVVPSRV